ncbi:hypothetical protein BC835DRAFT_1409771 [Cytidiella melzeri]|nr:hypothetical protein BC835DRAFT_1409771 [Cytidiella melzeri]
MPPVRPCFPPRPTPVRHANTQLAQTGNRPPRDISPDAQSEAEQQAEQPRAQRPPRSQQAPPQPSSRVPPQTVLADEQPEEEDAFASARRKDIINCLDDAKARNTSLHWRKFNMNARWVQRLLGPGVEIYKVLTYGPYCTEVDGELPALDAHGGRFMKNLKPSQRTKLGRQYELLFDLFPDFETDLEYYAADPDVMESLKKFLTAASDDGRADDCKTLKDGVLNYIPSPPVGTELLTVGNTKTARGWMHYSTARFLSPRDMLAEFDEDPEKFCADVLEGRKILEGGEFMAFMYDLDDAGFPTKLDAGLLRSPFLLSVFRHIFTGKSSALKKTPGPAGVGRRPIAVAAKRDRVSPEMIAWAAVMGYYALSSQPNWSVHDGTIDLRVLWDAVLNLFKNSQSVWAVETLQWWNLNVWGPSAVDIDERCQQPQRKTLAEQITEQRAAAQQESDVSD